jgi:hypothetical protein
VYCSKARSAFEEESKMGTRLMVMSVFGIVDDGWPKLGWEGEEGRIEGRIEGRG